MAHWSKQVQNWLSDVIDGYGSDGLWCIGRPLLVKSNEAQLRLFNGDTGVVVRHDGQPRAAFWRDGVLDLLAPSRLGDVQTLHAMSIHRSQGSQFDKVSIVLPPEGSPLLTQELLYTRSRAPSRTSASSAREPPYGHPSSARSCGRGACGRVRHS